MVLTEPKRTRKITAQDYMHATAIQALKCYPEGGEALIAEIQTALGKKVLYEMQIGNIESRLVELGEIALHNKLVCAISWFNRLYATRD